MQGKDELKPIIAREGTAQTRETNEGFSIKLDIRKKPTGKKAEMMIVIDCKNVFSARQNRTKER